MNNDNQKAVKKPVKEDPYSSFTVGSLIILAILLLFFFFGWSYIYNTDIKDVEIGMNGWNYICLGFSHDFKSMNKVAYGEVDSFYYWVKNLVVTETIITFVTFWLVIALGVVAFLNVKKANRKVALILGYASIVLALSFLACFVVALTMTPKMVSGFCSGNKACSVHSLALIPFFASIGNAIVNFVLAHKMRVDLEQPNF